MAKKQAAPKKRQRLVDLARATTPLGNRRKIFVDKVAPELREELIELREAYQTGQLPANLSASQIYRDVIEAHAPGLCSEFTFRRWLNTGSGAHG